jgi:tripartite-type tricarboxylate transporter receptor subunit TctC
VEAWYGLFAPLGTPKEMTTQLAGWFAAAIQAPELKPKLTKLGLLSAGTCGVDFSTSLRRQYELYGRVIREANVKAE